MPGANCRSALVPLPSRTLLAASVAAPGAAALATTSVPASVNVPLDVIGPPEVDKPVVPPENDTLVTVPPTLGVLLPAHVVPLDVRMLPDVPGATVRTPLVALPKTTLFSVREVCPVPPLATGNVPVTSAVSEIDVEAIETKSEPFQATSASCRPAP